MMALAKGMHGEYVPANYGKQFQWWNIPGLGKCPPPGPPPPGFKPPHECAAEMAAEAAALKAGTTTVDRFTQGSYLAVLCIAQFLVGAAIIPAQTLGFTYVDENVPADKSPIYMGLLLVSSFIGPGLGFFIASTVLGQWVDPYAEDKYILLKDKPFLPTYVGRWWIVYCAAFPIFFIFGCILLTFPKNASGAKQMREKERAQGHIREESAEAAHTSFKSFLKSTLLCITNPTLMCLCLGISAYTIAISGTAPFFTKIVTQKFGATFGEAGNLLGGITIAGTIFGLMGGALFIKMMNVKKSVNIATIICCFMAIMVVLFSMTFMVPGCKNFDIVKQSVNKCPCNGDFWWPTCDHSTGKTYFNPCMANCKSADPFMVPVLTPAGVKMLPGFDLKSMKQNSTGCLDGTMELRGMGCDKQCKNLASFGVVFFFLLFVGFASGTPHKVAVLRSVPYDQRALAVGFQFLCLKLFSSIPGPVIVGDIIDGSCVVWNRQCQKVDGVWKKVNTNCVEYDVNKLSTNIVITFAVTSTVAAIIYLISFFTSRKMMDDLEKQKKKQMEADEVVGIDNSAVAVSNTKLEDVDDVDDVKDEQ